MDDLLINDELIEQFLEGHDPQKYIVGIEAVPYSNEVNLIVNDPIQGKYIEKHTYTPFIWLKHKVALKMYDGDKSMIRKKMNQYGVSIKALKTENKDGKIPKRIEDGFKFIATCKGSYSDLQKFFKEGGVNTYSKGEERLFFNLSPEEQFLIQTGKRLFKGMDDYDDLHRLQFDLETEGLNPKKDRIFQVGVRDNRGFERVIEVRSETEELCRRENREPTFDEKVMIPKELRESEKMAIMEFFDIIDALKPDVITGYNSENFDWDYFYVRCDVLYINIESIARTLNQDKKIFRKDSTLKLGQETEYYKQCYMWGYNILDIMHAVRKAQAINSDIKERGLKYITKFSKVAKENRVYVDGEELFTTWASDDDFYFNDKNGDWFKLSSDENSPIYKVQQDKISTGNYVVTTGQYVVERYLLDDLWETEQIDNIFNQATFLISKILPTSFMRAATMGTAGTWKLIMAAWSYENNLAVPDFEPKREFTGGLARLLEVGYAKRVVKLDFAALYPKTQLTHGIAPDLDISGVMPFLLTYIVDTRDKYKFLKGDEGKVAKKLKDELSEKRDSLSNEEIKEFEDKISHHSKLSSNYDKKQLPLKILANSFFGSFGAPYLFPWGDIASAEETTCRGRQYLRLMVKHFWEKYGFRPLVGDTDGFNFAIPDNIDEIKYVCTAEHWKTSKYEKGQELIGLEAVLAEFNEQYMIGRMGLDIDDICESTINFARKNYANDIDGKIKLVGNSVKSKTMPIYIEEFLDKAVRLLLDGKGYEFIEYYYEYVNKIYNYEIPLMKIATKKRVKQSVNDYVNVYLKSTNKAGQSKAKQAHMELAVANNLKVDLGDMIYYVNTGTAKSHGDTKTEKDEHGNKITKLNCKLVSKEQMDKNPDLTTDEYNVPRYLNNFNKRVSVLLVCFHPDIRDQILIDVYNKKTTVDGKKITELLLEDRPYFTRKQCELDAGNPEEEEDQDSYEALMTMEDKEIKFWSSVNMVPNNMEEDEWKHLEMDWKQRMIIHRLDSIKAEKERAQDVFKRLEIEDLTQLEVDGILPKELLAFSNLDLTYKDGPTLFSNEWDVPLCPFSDILNYERDAKIRKEYYEANPELFVKTTKKKTKYDIYQKEMDKIKEEQGLLPHERFNSDCTEKLCCSEEWDGICPCMANGISSNSDIEDESHDYTILSMDKQEVLKDIEVCQNGKCGGCEHCDDMNSEESIRIEEEARLQYEEQMEIESEEWNKNFNVSLEDVKNCDDCDEDEWNF